MDLSVIVCSYNRYELVAQAVRSVEKSATSLNGVELIVVENTPLRQRQPLALGPRAQIVLCEQPGLSNARNAGIQASTGDIVAFVDDDAIVGEEWCAAVLRAFATIPDAAVCGGRTLPRFSSPHRPPWYFHELVHHLSCIDWGRTAHPLLPGQWIVGANMAFRRRVFEEVGFFDSALGRKGEASLLSNEEIAMIRRIGRERVYYIPDMVVEHVIAEERLCPEWFRKRVFWQAVSDVLAGETHKTAAQCGAELFNAVACLPAELRGHRLLSFEPSDAAQFRFQLTAVYAQTLLMSSGFPGFPDSHGP
jgi:glucosyl-dolichyl phosphate glucuronosyltransferase